MEFEKKIITNNNLGESAKDKKSKEEAKKLINCYIKLLCYSQNSEIFKGTWEVFAKFLQEKHPEIYTKFAPYGTKQTGYSLFRRPTLMPKDNNPLEGANNGINLVLLSMLGLILENCLTD